MTYAWSPKQRDMMTEIISGSKTEMVVSGPVQSGKSVSSVFAFMAYASQYTARDFLLCSRSQRQLDGATLKYAREFADVTGLTWRRRAGMFEMESLSGGTNRFYTLLGSDASSEGRARSFTAQGALIDEATLVPNEFLNSVADRCSRPGAKLILTTNPSGPMHPIKANMIDEGVTWYPFELSDNPMLTDEYIASLTRRYSGAMQRRMVYGEWASGEGAVYPVVPTGTPPVGQPERWVLAADYAHSSVTHAVLIGMWGSESWAVAEWRHDAREKGAINVREQARLINRDLVGGRHISLACVDPSAPAFRKALSHELRRRVFKSDNDVARGIQLVRQRFEDGTLTVGHRCPELTRELSNYVWDERAALFGDDKPVKQDDHGPDALRYGMYSTAIATMKAERKAGVVRV